MKESQTAAMEEFIDNVRILINALGYKVLEPTVHNDPNSTVDDEALFLNLGNASGKGMITTEGFVLFAGAVLNEKTSEKSLSKGAATLRKKHLASNKVKDFVTTEDCGKYSEYYIVQDRIRSRCCGRCSSYRSTDR